MFRSGAILCSLLLLAGLVTGIVFPQNTENIQITTKSCFTNKNPSIVATNGVTQQEFSGSAQQSVFGLPSCAADPTTQFVFSVQNCAVVGPPKPNCGPFFIDSILVENLPVRDPNGVENVYSVWESYEVMPGLKFDSQVAPAVDLKFNPHYNAQNIPNGLYKAKVTVSFSDNAKFSVGTIDFTLGRLFCSDNNQIECRFNLMISSDHEDNPNIVPMANVVYNGAMTAPWKQQNTIHFSQNAMQSDPSVTKYQYQFWAWLATDTIVGLDSSSQRTQDLSFSPVVVTPVDAGSTNSISAKVVVNSATVETKSFGWKQPAEPSFFVEVTCDKPAAQANIAFTVTFPNLGAGAKYLALPFQMTHICTPRQVTTGVFDMSTNGFFARGLNDIADCGLAPPGLWTKNVEPCHFKVFDNGFINPAFTIDYLGKQQGQANGDLLQIPWFRSLRSDVWFYAKFEGKLEDVERMLDWTLTHESSLQAIISPSFRKSCFQHSSNLTFCKLYWKFGCMSASSKKGSDQSWTDKCYGADQVTGLHVESAITASPGGSQPVDFYACKTCVVNPFSTLFIDVAGVDTTSDEAGKRFTYKGQSAHDESSLPFFEMANTQRKFDFSMWLTLKLGGTHVPIDIYPSYDVDAVTVQTSLTGPSCDSNTCSCDNQDNLCVFSANSTDNQARSILSVDVTCHWDDATTKIVVEVQPVASGQTALDPTYAAGQVEFWVHCQKGDQAFSHHGETSMPWPVPTSSGSSNGRGEVPGCDNSNLPSKAHVRWPSESPADGFSPVSTDVVFVDCQTGYKPNEKTDAWQCQATGGQGNIGWIATQNVQQNGFLTCTKNDDGGMSPAGVFFLVVFILSIVGCGAGAAWKHFRNGAQGIEMIPCINTLRHAFERCSGKTVHRQLNDDQGPHARENSTLDQSTAGYGSL